MFETFIQLWLGKRLIFVCNYHIHVNVLQKRGISHLPFNASLISYWKAY